MIENVHGKNVSIKQIPKTAQEAEEIRKIGLEIQARLGDDFYVKDYAGDLKWVISPTLKNVQLTGSVTL
jgi:hypothetical protein